jgi:hypothetical protein
VADGGSVGSPGKESVDVGTGVIGGNSVGVGVATGATGGKSVGTGVIGGNNVGI